MFVVVNTGIQGAPRCPVAKESLDNLSGLTRHLHHTGAGGFNLLSVLLFQWTFPMQNTATFALAPAPVHGSQSASLNTELLGLH